MKNKLRTPLLGIIEGLKAEGLDLSTDLVACDMIFPEHPEVTVRIEVGGLFFNPDAPGKELH